jgi:hypothetical protein
VWAEAATSMQSVKVMVTRNRKPLETAITYRGSRAKQDRTSKWVFGLSGESTLCFHGKSWSQLQRQRLVLNVPPEGTHLHRHR